MGLVTASVGSGHEASTGCREEKVNRNASVKRVAVTRKKRVAVKSKMKFLLGHSAVIHFLSGHTKDTLTSCSSPFFLTAATTRARAAYYFCNLPSTKKKWGEGKVSHTRNILGERAVLITQLPCAIPIPPPLPSFTFLFGIVLKSKWSLSFNWEKKRERERDQWAIP